MKSNWGQIRLGWKEIGPNGNWKVSPLTSFFVACILSHVLNLPPPFSVSLIVSVCLSVCLPVSPFLPFPLFLSISSISISPPPCSPPSLPSLPSLSLSSSLSLCPPPLFPLSSVSPSPPSLSLSLSPSLSLSHLNSTQRWWVWRQRTIDRRAVRDFVGREGRSSGSCFHHCMIHPVTKHTSLHIFSASLLKRSEHIYYIVTFQSVKNIRVYLEVWIEVPQSTDE